MGNVMRPRDEDCFDGVFVHLDAVARYARRRGARDPDDVAAECMTIAWRRLDDVPPDDPLPWLPGCARRVELWAADGSSATGACLGLRFPDGTWGAGKDNPNVGGNGPACFTERDDPMFKGVLIPTGIDALEAAVDKPTFNRIVYGIIDSDIPATAVRIVDQVTGASTPVIEGRWFAYVDPRADRMRDDRQLVAYDAAGKVVTGEPPAQEVPLPPATG